MSASGSFLTSSVSISDSSPSPFIFPTPSRLEKEALEALEKEQKEEEEQQHEPDISSEEMDSSELLTGGLLFSSSEERLSSVVSSASPVASSDAVDADADLDLVGEIILNTDSGKYHLDAGDGRLRDGKLYPKQFVRVSAIPAGGRLCTRCF